MTPKILDKEEVQKLVTSLNRNESKFYQFYNLEFSAEEYQFQDYLRNFKEGEATKKILNKSYYDIEIHYDPAVFPDADKAAYPINAIAVYNNITNVAKIFTVPFNGELAQNLEPEVQKIYWDLVQENSTYDIPNLKIEIECFKDDAELLKSFFLYLRSLNSMFLLGFNSSLFDDPYVVNRGLNLVGERIYDYISEFGEVKKFGDRSFEWPDILKVDLLQQYKPVDAGGMGLGSSLSSYKLNSVAHAELGIQKLDLEDMNVEYENNLPRFLAYNLLDTLLVYKLDEKLQFLELQWMLAKYNNAPMGSAIRGRSIMYRYRNNLIYSKLNKLVRSKIFGREVFYPIEKGA
jgi:DNA polymerase elongation subunit (family B)